MGGLIGVGNVIALLALVGWPIVVVIMFKRFPIERALIWSILGAYMFLPQHSAFNLPGMPALDKNSIPALTSLAMFAGIYNRFPSVIPKSFMGKVLLAMFVVSPSITVLTNLEPVLFGQDSFGSLTVIDGNALQNWGLPGLRAYDSISALAQQLFMLLPFFLAREVLRTEAAIRELLMALVIGAAIYTLPMLWEARMSPQLHTRLYGFFQHDFAQAIRSGGFRPFVFMPHGLWVAFFVFMCTMAAAARLRMADAKGRPLAIFCFVCTLGLLVVAKSWGPLLFATAFVPLVLFFTPRFQTFVAVMLVALVLGYPILRGSGIVPTEQIITSLEDVNAERAQSLEYRFNNEDRILEHAEDKPLFGWGGWGRFMVYDSSTGRSLTVVDGQWVIIIGHYGWLGFLAMFGLLALPIISVWRYGRNPNTPSIPLPVSALTLILAVNMVDLLPNATLVPLTWLIAGALLGFVENAGKNDDLEQSTSDPETPIRRTVLQDGGRMAPVLTNAQTKERRRTLL